MENQEQNNSMNSMWKKVEKSHRRGKIVGGILVASAGALFLGRELGMEIPSWLLTWKMFLIGMGVVIGVKHNFRRPMAYILIAIGGLLFLGDFFPLLNIKHLVWPAIITLIGISMIFKPFRRRKHMCYNKFHGHYAHHHCKGWNMGTEQNK